MRKTKITFDDSGAPTTILRMACERVEGFEALYKRYERKMSLAGRSKHYDQLRSPHRFYRAPLPHASNGSGSRPDRGLFVHANLPNNRFVIQNK